LLSRFARRSVTVALSGDGGDELFAGYDPFVALGIARWYRMLVPEVLHRGVRRLADLLPRSSANMSFDFRLRRALRGVSFSPELWNPAWIGPLEPAEIAELFHEAVRPEEIYADAANAWKAAASPDPVDRSLEFYTRFYLQDGVLAKVDRASMMHSLEVRSPFLDNDLVDFARRLPSRYKLKRGRRKHILKEALAPLLPAAVLNRPKKGFGIPLRDWMRAIPPRAGKYGIPIVDEEVCAARWRAHRAGSVDHRQFLWCCLVLQYHFNPGADLARHGA
jgi:asparagine synthase (glutamine-hydrolysing)